MSIEQSKEDVKESADLQSAVDDLFGNDSGKSDSENTDENADKTEDSKEEETDSFEETKVAEGEVQEGEKENSKDLKKGVAASDDSSDKSEDSVDDDVEDPKYAAMLKRIEDLSGKVVTPVVEAKTEKPSEVETTDDFDSLVADLDFETAISSKEDFVKTLRSVHDIAVKKAMALASKNLMMSIPDIITHQVRQFNDINESVKQFYSENPDLVKVKKTVGLCADEITSEHPDWSPNQVFAESAIRARELLGMKKVAKGKTSTEPISQKRNPTLPRSNGAGRVRAKTPGLKSLEDEVNELIG